MSDSAKRSAAFHPPLIAAFPVLAIFSANTGLFPLHDLYRPTLVAAVFGLVVWLLASAIRRSWERGAMFASIFVGASWIYEPITGRFNLPMWIGIVFLVALTAVSWWISGRERLPTALLNRFAAFLVVVACATIGLHARGTGVAGAVKSGPAAAKKPPDVFFILLDGYGRADQLKRVMSYDNSGFVKAMKVRGFVVPERNHSNYVQTALSLSSILNMDYVQTLLPEISRSFSDREPLLNLVNHPRMVRDLRAHGYDSIAIGTGFPSFEFQGFDLALAQPPPITYFEMALLEHTPFSVPEGIMESQFQGRNHLLESGFSELRRLSAPTLKPRFIFAHILAPHPPFVFDAKGNQVRQKGTFGFFDGSDYMEKIGDATSYRNGYTGQLQWVNSQVLQTVDTLLSRPGPKPIILFQGDHGSKEGLHQNSLEKTDLIEALAPLGAYYVPDEVRPKLGDDVTPVNAIRAVMSDITGEDLPPLPQRVYYSPFDRPYDFTDITSRLTP